MSATNAQGSARVSRVGFGVTLKQPFSTLIMVREAAAQGKSIIAET